MVSVHDVAAYILQNRGPMTAMKLQKLCYYSQAWNLVWEEQPLFHEEFQAWANGPVCPELYSRHRGLFQVSDWPAGDSKALSSIEASTVDIVLDFYGDRPAHELSELTHRESPWRDARADLPAGSRSNTVISTTAMHEYYDGLVGTGE